MRKMKHRWEKRQLWSRLLAQKKTAKALLTMKLTWHRSGAYSVQTAPQTAGGLYVIFASHGGLVAAEESGC